MIPAREALILTLMIGSSLDIYFAGDDSSKFLPWITGIMIFLATFLLCVAISAGQWVSSRHDSLEGSFTVNLPASTPGISDKATLIEEKLRRVDSVQAIRRLPDEEMSELLRPWLGEISHSEQLPVPIVIEVTLKPKQSKHFDYKALQLELRTIASGVEVDAQELWMQAFSRFSSATQQIVTLFASLIVCGLAMLIAFTSRAALKLHAKTVQLLHSIGAEDRYVTRQFQIESLRLTLPGALIGTITAALAFAGLCTFIDSLDSALMPAFTFSMMHFIMLGIMPLASLLLSWIVARMTVMQQLERSL